MQQFDEFLISSEDDSALERFEHTTIENIRNQIQNTYGDFSGCIDSETDFVMEYVQHVFEGGDHTTIDDFEHVCNISGFEDQYDYLSNGIIHIFEEELGVFIDLNRENFLFSDIYDIYIALVLSLKDTIKLSTEQHYMSTKGFKISNLTLENVSEYCLSDEFSSTDHFFKNAALNCGCESIKNIQQKIEDFTITLDHDRFVDYIYKYMTNVLF